MSTHRVYVHIKGKTQGQFKAESKKDGRKDKWLECVAFKMSSNVPVDANSGAVKGFRQHQPLSLTKECGAASAQILQAHWNNEVLDEVVIEMVARDEGGKKEKVRERITLKDAVIVGVERYSDMQATGAVEHDVDELETVKFRFRQIMVENPDAGTSTSDDWHGTER